MTKKLRLLLDRDRHSNGIVSISMRESPRMLSYFYWVGFNTCDAALNAELGERNIFHCRQTRMRKALMKSHRIFSAFPAHSVKCASVFLFASIASASHAQVMPPTGAPTTPKGGCHYRAASRTGGIRWTLYRSTDAGRSYGLHYARAAYQRIEDYPTSTSTFTFTWTRSCRLHGYKRSCKGQTGPGEQRSCGHRS